jgi:hypothetical protein
MVYLSESGGSGRMTSNKKNRENLARQGVFNATVIAALSLLQSPLHAQDDTAVADDEWLEEVVVTGSRIARRDFASPSPITTIDRDAIEASAQATLEETLNRMPQVLPDFGRAANNPGDGTARINLRGLGAGRSLVMLNSRRLAPSGMGSAVVSSTSSRGTISRASRSKPTTASPARATPITTTSASPTAPTLREVPATWCFTVATTRGRPCSRETAN